MTTMDCLSSEAVVLAGAREVRVLGSTAEAERALAEGFRPALVLLGRSRCGPEGAELARKLGADPTHPAVPVLAVTGDGDWLRLTALSDDLVPPAAPEELGRLLEVLEELCSEPLRRAG